MVAHDRLFWDLPIKYDIVVIVLSLMLYYGISLECVRAWDIIQCTMIGTYWDNKGLSIGGFEIRMFDENGNMNGFIFGLFVYCRKVTYKSRDDGHEHVIQHTYKLYIYIYCKYYITFHPGKPYGSYPQPVIDSGTSRWGSKL